MTGSELADILDIEAIKALKYRYVRTLDLKQWDQFADCLLPEATGDYAGLVFDDRDSLVAYMSENMGPALISMHHLHHPEIELRVNGDPDVARGTWALADRVLLPEMNFALEGAAFYSDTYRRTPEGWKIAATGYRRTHEVTWSTADVASWTLKRGTAYDA